MRTLERDYEDDPVEELRRVLVARARREESRRQEQEERRRRRLQIARTGLLHAARAIGAGILRAMRLASSWPTAASTTPGRLGAARRRFAVGRRSAASDPPSIGAEEPEPARTDTRTSRELEMERLDRRQLWLREESLGPDHPDLVPVARLVAQHDWAHGNRLEALLLYERAYSISERVLGPDHTELAAIAEELGDMYLEVDEPAQAGLWKSRATAIRERSAAPGGSPPPLPPIQGSPITLPPGA